MSKAEIERNTGDEDKKRKHALTVIENIYYFASAPAKVCSYIRRTFTHKHKTLRGDQRNHIYHVYNI